MSTFRESGVNDLEEKGFLPKRETVPTIYAGLMPKRYKTVTKFGGELSHIGEETAVCGFPSCFLCCFDSR